MTSFSDIRAVQRGICLLLLILTVTLAHSQQWDKINNSVLSERVQRLSVSKDSGRVMRFMIQTYDLQLAEEILTRHHLLPSIKGKYSPGKVIVVELPLTRVREVFGKTGLIRFIDARPSPVEETHINGFDRTANGLNLMRAKYPAYNGHGLVVSIKERRFDTSDIDLRERIVLSGLEAQAMTTHASQMATMIAGGGNSSDHSLGAAWGAEVASSSFEMLLPDPIESYVASKVTVQNHSYGTAIENYYGADAASYDGSVRSLPYLLHVFSAGNSGDLSPGGGQYAGAPGYANITGSFKMAKNILTVGATDSLSRLEPRSSRGPAYDGRIKPELVAYGHDGSSGAAAIVSGIALTLQQAYKEKEGELPNASLIKGIIMNSADDLGKPGPDFETGYGAANGFRALQAVDSGWYVSASSGRGEVRQHQIMIPAGVSRLKFMLTWSDPEAEANAAKALVNDLDLEVSDVFSNIFNPWVLKTGKTELSLPASTGRDTLNNVEQVSIEDPAAGMYTLTVRNLSGSSTPQDYSITYYYEKKNHFEWTYPAAFEQVRSDDRNLLRWNTNLNGTGLLSVSTDSGFSWKAIAGVSDLALQNREWYPDPGFYSAQLKMEIQGQEYFSPPFQVSSSIQPRVILNCEDSALVSWSPLPGVSNYKIFELIGKYIEAVQITSDTFFTLQKEAGEFIAVAPVITDTIGQRGFTQNVNTQGAGCYSNNLLADLQPNGDVNISFEAGTIHRVAAISLERSFGGSFTEIEKEGEPDQLRYAWVDKQVKQGLSFYRVKITLENNEDIYSLTVQVSNPAKHDFLFFPNPVRAGQPLTILSANTDDAVLLIYDVVGRKVLQRNLVEQLETVHINNSGTYFYQVQVAGKPVKSGKLVVN